MIISSATRSDGEIDERKVVCCLAGPQVHSNPTKMDIILENDTISFGNG